MAGRKTLAPATQVGPDFVGATPPDMAAQEARARDVLTAAENYGQERDLLNQLLGQAQMAGAFEEFSRTVRRNLGARGKSSAAYLDARLTKLTEISPTSKRSARKPSNPCPAWASATAS